MPASPVSVVIVNWHSEALLAEVLAGLDRQTAIPEQVVVVDNGSAAPLPLERYTAGPLHVLSLPGNPGFAAGNNQAIRERVDSEWVALLNPDAIPAPDWLEQLLAATTRHPEFSAFGSRQLMGEDPGRLDGLGDVYHVSGAAWRRGHGQEDGPAAAAPREIFSPCAAAALYRRAALLDAGGFDEDFFCYLEDVDLGFRLRLYGYRAMLVPAAVVHHLGGGTSGGGRSDFAVFHGQRNLVWAYVKNMPGASLWQHLPQHFLLNFAALFFYALRGQGGTVLRAKWQALRGLPRMWRKRQAIQAQRRVASGELRRAMAGGWLSPYRRGARQSLEI